MESRRWARDHVPALTAVLTTVSLALVFGAVLQLIPVGTLPRREVALAAIPHVNAVISLAAITTIAGGVRAIRHGRVGRHRALMLASVALFALFLVLYLYRVALVGPAEFPGPESVRTFVYLPVLTVHVALAVVCVPFVFYALLLAATRPVPDLYPTDHARVGRIAAALWIVSFGMGLSVYLMLYAVF